MIIHKTVAEVQSTMYEFSKEMLKTGFVPTMGALHEGHMSLVRRAKSENDRVIVSIFVNPTQFNNPVDLQNYPRMPDKDFEMLQREGPDVIFFPSESEIYPNGVEVKASFDFGQLEKVMEGKFRPGHFKGVAQVVSRLFEITDPDNAYFGEKDYQQLVIIRQLAEQKKYRVKITGCPTMREPDGLAMSSRNLLLTPEMRKEAAKISKALFHVRDNRNKKSLQELKSEAANIIEGNGLLKIEYLEVADAKTLQSLETWDNKNPLRCLTAVQAGNIRLIDNVEV
jgi:pantoate--beta-alanine ligase